MSRDSRYENELKGSSPGGDDMVARRAASARSRISIWRGKGENKEAMSSMNKAEPSEVEHANYDPG